MKNFLPITYLLFLGACGLAALVDAFEESHSAYIYRFEPIEAGQPNSIPPRLYRLAVIERRVGSGARFEGALNGELPMPDLNSRTNTLEGPIVENPNGTAVRAEFQGRLAVDPEGSKLFIWNLNPLRITFSRYQSEAGMEAIEICNLTALYQNELADTLQSAPRYNPDLPIEVTWRYQSFADRDERPFGFVGWAATERIVTKLVAEVSAQVRQGAATVLSDFRISSKDVYLTYSYSDRGPRMPTCAAERPETLADPVPLYSIEARNDPRGTAQIFVDNVRLADFPTSDERPELIRPYFFPSLISGIFGPYE